MLSEATPMHTASERLKRVWDVQTRSSNKLPNSNTDGVAEVGRWKCIIVLYDEMHNLRYVYVHSIDVSVSDLSPWPKTLCEFIFTEELQALEALFKEVIFPAFATWIMLYNLPWLWKMRPWMTSFLARCTFLKLALHPLDNAIQNKHAGLVQNPHTLL